MENPASGGARECPSSRSDAPEYTRHTTDTQAACRAIEAGLVYLPDACEMAGILRRRLDLPERIWLGASALMALPPDTAEELAEATLTDVYAARHSPVEVEAKRQRQRWIKHCADPTRRARRARR